MDDQPTSKSRAGLRLCAAMVGASAIVAMAAIGLMVAQEHVGDPTAKSSTMTIGSTTTQTTPTTVPVVGMAKPDIKGPAPLPSEEARAR
jgi:hypothetical protein